MQLQEIYFISYSPIHMSTELSGINIEEFDVTGEPMIRYCFRQAHEKKKCEYNGEVCQLVTDFGEADSVEYYHYVWYTHVTTQAN
jgi:hypothetical protein